MEIDLWSGEWNLPSIDHNCLKNLAFARFSGAPLKLNYSNNPWKHFGNNLPVFKHGNKTKLRHFKDIVKHLKTHNYNADNNLSKKQLADLHAYQSLITDKLEPILLYILWIDEKNYIDITRPWYAKQIPFPGNYFIPGHLKREAERMLQTKFPDYDVFEIENYLLSEAKKCLTLLSEKLEHNDFFMGQIPTSLDAIAFGYLAPILHIPFQSCISLKNHLIACENLSSFVQKILTKYFPLSKINKKEEKLNQTNDDIEFPHKWRDIVFSTIFAAFSMVAYAMGSGIVRISKVEELEYLDYLDEEESPPMIEVEDDI